MSRSSTSGTNSPRRFASFLDKARRFPSSGRYGDAASPAVCSRDLPDGPDLPHAERVDRCDPHDALPADHLEHMRLAPGVALSATRPWSAIRCGEWAAAGRFSPRNGSATPSHRSCPVARPTKSIPPQGDTSASTGASCACTSSCASTSVSTRVSTHWSISLSPVPSVTRRWQRSSLTSVPGIVRRWR